MAWLAVDNNGNELIFQFHPRKNKVRYLPLYSYSMYVKLPKGSIKKLIGRELSWEDEPVEI